MADEDSTKARIGRHSKRSSESSTCPIRSSFVLLRIDDRDSGRELMLKASAVVASAPQRISPAGDAWVSVALTFHGLKALGVRQDCSRQLRAGIPTGYGRKSKNVSEILARAARKTGKSRLGHPMSMSSSLRLHQTRAARTCTRAGQEIYSRLRGNSGDLAPGLPRSPDRERAIRIQRRHQPSGCGGKRNSWFKSRRTTFQGR